MTEEILREKERFERELRKLEKEILDKTKGYATEIKISTEIFPAMSTPKVELLLLDRDDKAVAFRRVSEPFQGRPRKGPWKVADLAGALKDAYAWLEEMAGIVSESGHDQIPGLVSTPPSPDSFTFLKK